jgi:hypothetical protein
MKSLNNISKQELFDLLEAAIDGIDGVESEEGVEELRKYWDVAKIDRARSLIDAVRASSVGEKASSPA